MQRHIYIVPAALGTRATERYFSYFVQAKRKACPRLAVPKLDETTRPGSPGQRREEERRRWEGMVAEAEIIMKELRALLKKGVTNLVDSSGMA